MQEEWEERLRASGFRDIEAKDRRTGELRLKEWDSHYFHIRTTPETFAIKQEYFAQAYQFLNSHRFKSKTDRHIWQLHSEGVGLRKIAESLKTQGVKTNKDYVSAILKRLKEAMKEATQRQWKKESSLLLED